MGILFTAPQFEYEEIREAWLAQADEIARQGVLVGGAYVRSFETALAERTGAAAAAALGSGTDALFLTLKALGIGPGDEVITAANTFAATVAAIYHTGAKPVLADCDERHLLDFACVQAAATPATKAVIPVHLYGRMIDLEPWKHWAGERGIAIVEDCAQAAGASLRGRHAGSFGAAGCFSFYPDKNLGALGDGGAVVSSSAALVAAVRRLRNHGGEVRYEHLVPGYNSRLDPIQCCALLLKLPHLSRWNDSRRRAARRYTQLLSGIDGLVLPAPVPEEQADSHVYHLYVVRVLGGRRTALKKHLQKKGILTGIQYPAPVHLLPAYASLGYRPGDFPRAEAYADEILSLPMHAGLRDEEIDEVCGEIRSFLETDVIAR